MLAARRLHRLRLVEADVVASYPEACSILHNEAPFEALRLRRMCIYGSPNTDTAVLTAKLAAHPSLRELTLLYFPLPTFAALDAVVDTALALRLTRLELHSCRMGPASAVASPRLLRGDTLRELKVYGQAVALLDAHAAALLADALHSNRTLTSLQLVVVHLWYDAGAAAAALFGALVGHASLTDITVSQNDVRFAAGADVSAGALLGALVAANSPLCKLDVADIQLGDAGLGPLVDALPHSSHLRELYTFRNAMSAAFARGRLMPALAANTSLLMLVSGYAEADEFIAARTAAMAAAARA